MCLLLLPLLLLRPSLNARERNASRRPPPLPLSPGPHTALSVRDALLAWELRQHEVRAACPADG